MPLIKIICIGMYVLCMFIYLSLGTVVLNSRDCGKLYGFRQENFNFKVTVYQRLEPFHDLQKIIFDSIMNMHYIIIDKC